MKIDKSNYEAFFLDYHEGNLDPQQVESLMAFLDSEPGLRSVFEEYEMIAASARGEVKYEEKGKLKRGEVTPENYEWYFAAYLEGELDTKERKMVESFASVQPGMQKELGRMLQTKLQPDYTLAFPHKNALKRAVVIPLYGKLLRIAGTAAAVLVLFYAGYLLIQQPDANLRLSNTLTTPPQSHVEQILDLFGNVQDQMAETLPEDNNVSDEWPTVVQHAATFPEEEVETTLAPQIQTPLLAGKLPSLPARITVRKPFAGQEVDTRTEIAYLRLADTQDGTTRDVAEPVVQVSEQPSMPRSLADDLRRIERRLSENRPHSIVALAGASLLELNRMVGEPVQWQTRIDDNRKTVQVRIGNIEISRRTP